MCNNFLFCLERSALDWELAVDRRGELFYIDSNPLEKSEHGSAEPAEKADASKYLGTLNRNRCTTRGLSQEMDFKIVAVVRNRELHWIVTCSVQQVVLRLERLLTLYFLIKSIIILCCYLLLMSSKHSFLFQVS
jgi:hypothetical protein